MPPLELRRAGEFCGLFQRFARVVGLSASPWSQGCSELFGQSDSISCPYAEAQKAHLAARYEIKPWSPERGPWALVFCSTNNECESEAPPGLALVDRCECSCCSCRNVSEPGKDGALDVLYVNRMLLEGFDEKRCSNV